MASNLFSSKHARREIPRKRFSKFITARKGQVIKYLLGWAGGKIESFSESLMAQPERNTKFLWPTSMAEKFFMAHPYVVELVTKGY